jgi:hypothetical protein
VKYAEIRHGPRKIMTEMEFATETAAHGVLGHIDVFRPC